MWCDTIRYDVVRIVVRTYVRVFSWHDWRNCKPGKSCDVMWWCDVICREETWCSCAPLRIIPLSYLPLIWFDFRFCLLYPSTPLFLPSFPLCLPSSIPFSLPCSLPLLYLMINQTVLTWGHKWVLEVEAAVEVAVEDAVTLLSTCLFSNSYSTIPSVPFYLF